MSPVVITLIGLALFILLASQSVPIGVCFAVAGSLGIILLRGFDMGLFVLGYAPFSWSTNPSLIVVPLFVLMGEFMFRFGISTDLFVTAYKFVGRYKGGLAVSTMLACTGFAACSGSSMASAATMSSMAYSEMGKYKYDTRLSTGSIAAGGTLATLIPPSGGMIIYGFLTDESIGELFIAGLIPGLLLSALFIMTIFITCKRNPHMGPAGPSFPLKEMLTSIKNVWGVIALFCLVLGGLYFGIFTPNEAGAIGSVGALLIGIIARRITKKNIIDSVLDTVKTTSFLFTIIFGAMIFNSFLGLSGITTVISQWINSLEFSPHIILIIILLFYIPLGMFMDVMAMTLLTIPIIYPIIISLGFDGVWFGILIILLSEIALITPPVGMNVFVVSGKTGIPLQVIFRGIVPFLICLIVFLAILIIFPQIALALPGMMH